LAHHPDTQLTILFTDIEGSTELLEILGNEFEEVLDRHLSLLRSAILKSGGKEVDVHGDAYFAVFKISSDAVAAAVTAQRSLFAENWPKQAQVRVRMSLHTGNPRQVSRPPLGYVGLDVHRAARICSIASGGQILLSSTVRNDPNCALPPGVKVRDLGTHRLKDIRFPEPISDLAIEGLPDQFAPIRSLDNRPNNLPTALRPFIDREADKVALKNIVQQQGVRLVTLTGAGGTGKTRLSVEVATGLLDVFQGGVFEVKLAAITLPSLVAPTIAQTLGIQEIAGRPIIETIKHSIISRRLLLLLDNFEHLVSAAPIIVDLLDSCPLLRILVTSREALGIAPEREYPLSPLQTPSASAGSDLEKLLSYDAVRLFVERVRDFRADFRLTPTTGPVVSEICRRLDGLPLGIELAASRLRLLEPLALLQRLRQREETLGKTPSLPGERHQSLKHAIGWSYDLLDPVEQKLFCHLSVFAGGFSIESAITISRDIGSEGEILEFLTSLVRKSLVQRGISQGEVRLTMLETVREFGQDKLRELGRLEDSRKFHMICMRKIAEEAAPLLLGPQYRQGISTFLDELDNIRAALDFALQQCLIDAVSGFLRSLLWFWIPRGQFTEGEAWITRALVLSGDLSDTSDQAAILETAGWLKAMAGDWNQALPYFRRCRPIYERLEMADKAAMAQMMEGITLAVSAEDKSALENVCEALRKFRELQNPYGIGLTLTALGEAARLERDYNLAQIHFDEALAVMRQLGNAHWIGALLQNLAHVRLQLRDWFGAMVLLKETSETVNESENPLSIVYYIMAMGRVALFRGKMMEAAQLFGSSSSFLKSMGAKMHPADQAEFDSSVAAANTDLGTEKFQAYFEQGAMWSREQAIAATLALRED
jgi:predicted ATPase/class 3 adenylate cyclase